MPSGSTDLAAMLQSLDVTVRPDEYVYVTVESEHAATRDASAVIDEAEGRTLVLRRIDADQHALPYDYVVSWITLTVHSSLEAVGLTSTVSRALANKGVSCNVLAGFYHDHLLVPAKELSRALAALRSLRAT